VPPVFKSPLVVDVCEHAFIRDLEATERNKDIEASLASSAEKRT